MDTTESTNATIATANDTPCTTLIAVAHGSALTSSGLVWPSSGGENVKSVRPPATPASPDARVAATTIRHRGVSDRPSGNSSTSSVISITNTVSNAVDETHRAAWTPGQSPGDTTRAYTA